MVPYNDNTWFVFFLKRCESWLWSSMVPRYVGVKCLTLDWRAWVCLVMPTSPLRWHRVETFFLSQSAFVSWLVGFTPVCSHGAASSLWLLSYCLSLCPDRERCLWLLCAATSCVCYDNNCRLQCRWWSLARSITSTTSLYCLQNQTGGVAVNARQVNQSWRFIWACGAARPMNQIIAV